MKKLFAVVAMFVVLPAAVFMQDEVVVEVAPKPYLVQKGDKIVGKVLGESDFNFEVYVSDTGDFTLPYVNVDIPAQCRTEKEIYEDVERHYSTYLKDPMISVAVAERLPTAVVTISGQIRTPQRVELKRETRLMELISFSGGFNEDAGGTVQVFRTQPPPCADEAEKNAWKELTSNGTEIPSSMYSRASMNDGRNESNPIINPGDLIIVDKADPVYLTGEVVDQSGVYIKEGGLSLTQALAMVGGVKYKANTKDIKIYRRKGESLHDRETIAVNLKLIKEGKQNDVMLQPYDIIEVDRGKDSIASQIFKIVTGAGKAAVSSISTYSGRRILY